MLNFLRKIKQKFFVSQQVATRVEVEQAEQAFYINYLVRFVAEHKNILDNKN